MLTPELTGPESELFQSRIVKGPPLSTLRLVDGRFHIDVSYAARPVLIYVYHVLPAYVWSIIAPLQFDTEFRNKHRQIHAASGYLFFALSALLDVTGLYMIATRFTFSHKNRAHLHFGFLPTFDAALTFLGVIFGITLVIALDAARKRDFRKHRIFTMAHTCAGMTVHYQRIVMYSQWGIVHLLANLSPKFFERLVGLPAQWSPNLTKEIGLLELEAFVLNGYAGALLAALTAWYVLSPLLSKTDASTKPYSVAVTKKTI